MRQGPQTWIPFGGLVSRTKKDFEQEPPHYSQANMKALRAFSFIGSTNP